MSISSRIIDATRSAHFIVHELLSLKPSEDVLIVADTCTEPEIYHSLAGAVLAEKGDFTIAIMPARTEPEEATLLTRAIMKAYEGCDVVIPCAFASGAPQYNTFWYPLLHGKKIRVMSLSQRSLSNMTEGGALADYEQIAKRNEPIKSLLTGATEVHITSEFGTDLRFTIAGRKVFANSGYARNPGDFGCFPDGEVYISPGVGSAEGEVFVDGPIAYVGSDHQPLELHFCHGRITEVVGNDSRAIKLRKILASIKNADNLGEFGIGTNPRCRFTSDVSETKKRLGTIHLAYGRNFEFDIASEIHGDMILNEPTVEVDGRKLLTKGELVY